VHVRKEATSENPGKLHIR